jgi:hypothetical protein
MEIEFFWDSRDLDMNLWGIGMEKYFFGHAAIQIVFYFNFLFLFLTDLLKMV